MASGQPRSKRWSTLTTKTQLERLAEHYDRTDTAKVLEKATAAASAEPGATERTTTFAVRLAGGGARPRT